MKSKPAYWNRCNHGCFL